MNKASLIFIIWDLTWHEPRDRTTSEIELVFREWVNEFRHERPVDCLMKLLKYSFSVARSVEFFPFNIPHSRSHPSKSIMEISKTWRICHLHLSICMRFSPFCIISLRKQKIEQKID